MAPPPKRRPTAHYDERQSLIKKAFSDQFKRQRSVNQGPSNHATAPPPATIVGELIEEQRPMKQEPSNHATSLPPATIMGQPTEEQSTEEQLTKEQLTILLELNDFLNVDDTTSLPLLQQSQWDATVAANKYFEPRHRRPRRQHAASAPLTTPDSLVSPDISTALGRLTQLPAESTQPPAASTQSLAASTRSPAASTQTLAASTLHLSLQLPATPPNSSSMQPPTTWHISVQMPVNQNLASQNSASQNIVILTDQNFIGHNLASQNPTSQNIVVLTDQNLAGQNFTSPTNQNLADQSIAGQLQGKSSGDNDTRLFLKHTKRRNTEDLTSDDDTHTVASQAADLVPTLVPTYPGSVQPSSHARAHKPWSTWNVARFRYTTNSATRVRRFEHLSGSALAHAISPLPEWEQLHELNFLFNDFDVLVTYIVDIEGFTVVAKHNNTPDAIMRAMISHGFHVSLVVKSRSFARYRNVKSALSKTMDDLFATTPSPTPTSMLPGEFILRMPGHTGELIVLSDQDTFKGNNFQVGNYKEVPEMCPKAAMEIYNDVHAREHLITLWWSRLRILDPILRPWRRGEKMTDVNLQVLDPNHPVHKCMPPFWSLKFQN